MLEEEPEQLLLDDIFVECADVGIDVFEEVWLFRVFHGVNILEIHQCFVKFNCVEIVLDLIEVVLLGEHLVDRVLVVEHIYVFDVHLN